MPHMFKDRPGDDPTWYSSPGNWFKTTRFRS